MSENGTRRRSSISRGRCVAMPEAAHVQPEVYEEPCDCIASRRCAVLESAASALSMAAHHDTRLPGILLLLADGYTQAEIADTLGMTQQGVSQLVKEFRSTA